MPKDQEKEVENIESADEEIELNQDLMDSFGEEIENAIEKVLNKKDWDAETDLELLTILMMFATQTALSIGMEEDEIHNFMDQFLEPDEEDEDNQELEIYSINTQVKNNGRPN